MRNENDPFNRSGLSKRTLFEFLRANTDAAATTAHPVHRTPWIQKPRSTVPMSFPTTGKSESKTALQRLAETTGAEATIRLGRASASIRANEAAAIDVGSPAKPPPMFGSNNRKRALVVNHVKGSTPERIRKLRSMTTTENTPSAFGQGRLLTIDDLHRSVLGIDFQSLESSLVVPASDLDARISFDSLEEYKEHQSQVLLVETMEGLKQSLQAGYAPVGQQQSGMYSCVDVQITTAVRKGREFSLLTLKRVVTSEDKNQRFLLGQGDVVLLFKPSSPVLDGILKYGFMSESSPTGGLVSSDEQPVMYGIIEKSKPSLVIGRETKSVQFRCPLASKDAPLGYSPSVGSEFVAVIIHSLLTVEREWSALCALRPMDWFTNVLLAKQRFAAKPHTQSSRFNGPSGVIEKLNESQKNAVVQAATREEKSMVLTIGPPGTGKSHTLVSLLQCYEFQGLKKVIVAAPSNAAIDELMLRFVKARGTRSVVRIGRNSSVAELASLSLDQRVADSQAKTEESRYEVYKQRKEKLFADIARMNSEINSLGEEGTGHQKAELIRMKERVKTQLDNLKSKEEEHVRVERDSIYKKFLSDAQFVFGTLSSFGSDVIVSNLVGDVDVCVIDEAAQAIEVSSLIPIRFRPRKIVLVGDPQQLPAVVKSATAKRAGFDMSLMERLEQSGLHEVHILTEQYRMDAAISEFPSNWFYEGKLGTASSVFARAPAPVSSVLGSPLAMIDVDGAGDMKQGTSLINPREARVAVDLVRFVLSSGNSSSIGVISPYRQQVNLIRNLLARELDAHYPRLEVDSVDAFQGREKDVVIFSCVRAGGSSGSSIGFLADHRRLNVAITRARRAVWLIGSIDFLSRNGGPVWKALISHTKVIDNVVALPSLLNVQES